MNFLARIGSAIQKWGTPTTVPVRQYGGWFGVIRESFAGAFQSVVEIDAPRDILSYAGMFAPVTLIAGDVAKLRLKLMRKVEKSCYWDEVTAGSPFLQVLRKPNHFQTRVQFIEMWMLSKLLWGNTYVYKMRDGRGVVTELYILDPERITPLVAPDGSVFYRISADYLSMLPQGVTLPASEIIHDRWNCLWHPLVGIAPLYAAGLSATQGRRIQTNSANFFGNMSRPGGMLTAPDSIDDETAGRIKREFEDNFGGGKIGRTFVAGSGLKFESMALPAEASQLVEQLEWTVKDIARAYSVPYFMVGGEMPRGTSIEAESIRYYQQCLQKLLEQAEACLDDGLGLAADTRTEFDVSGLIRMDTAAQYEALGKVVGAGIMAPNEARARISLPPVTGGESPMVQQQNYSLAALAKRDGKDDPFSTSPASSAPAPEPAEPPDPTDPEDSADSTDKALHLLFRKSPEELIHA